MEDGTILQPFYCAVFCLSVCRLFADNGKQLMAGPAKSGATKNAIKRVSCDTLVASLFLFSLLLSVCTRGTLGSICFTRPETIGILHNRSMSVACCR